MKNISKGAKIAIIAAILAVAVTITVTVTVSAPRDNTPQAISDKDRDKATKEFLEGSYEKAPEPDYTFK